MQLPDDVEPIQNGWVHMPSGDWSLYRDGEQLGIVCYQNTAAGRTWYSVSTAKNHGPEAGRLTQCKRRLEALWL